MSAENQAVEIVTEEVTLENEIKEQLVKANVTDTVIAKLKAEYGDLRLANLEDKESYLAIKAAARDCSKLRNLAVKICKEGRDYAVKIQKKWVAKEKEVIAKIAEVEDVLDGEIYKYDAEIKRKEIEEAQRKENEYMSRTQTLTKIGATYSNAEFSLGEFTIDAFLVKDCSQEVWEGEMLLKFQEQYEIIEAARIEEQKKKDAEAAELKRKQDEFAEEQRQFELKQAAFKKQQEEAEQAEKQKQLAEQKERMELNNKRLHLLLPYNPYTKNVDTSNLWSLDETEFIDLLNNTKVNHEQEEADKKAAMQEEIAAKERAKMEEENRLAEIKRQQDEAKKAEELASAGDKANWEYFIAQLNNLAYPQLKSGRYLKIGAIAKEKLEEILTLKP